MKKLNRKGFTLIELLAVIVILAIVMVVTIPSVINAMNSARSGQLKNAADTVAEWFQKNYELDTYAGVLADNPADTAYLTWVSSNPWMDGSNPKTVALCTTTGSGDSEQHECDIVGTAGVSNAGANIATGYAKLVSNKVCVTLTAKEGGSFYVNGTTNQSQTSTGCADVVPSNP